jgi:hypothetical protein
MLREGIVLIGVPLPTLGILEKPRGMVHPAGKEARDYRSLIVAHLFSQARAFLSEPRKHWPKIT